MAANKGKKTTHNVPIEGNTSSKEDETMDLYHAFNNGLRLLLNEVNLLENNMKRMCSYSHELDAALVPTIISLKNAMKEIAPNSPH